MKVDSDSILGSGKIFPPGFRFHPTDEELILYYLKKKISCKRHRIDVIAEVDVYKWDPEDLPEMSKLKTGDRQWFFFSPRDRKYPNGARSNRGTKHGYWKATGKDRKIPSGPRDVGLKKTLVFYRGRPPAGERTDWVMHEYTLDEEELRRCDNVHDYYALYKVYKKSGPGPKNGEQYGAPFREEDWADEESPALNAALVADEPVPPQPFVGDSGFFLEEFPGPAENPVLKSNDRLSDFQAGFDLLQSNDVAQLQLRETSEVTSDHAVNEKERTETEEEDFLKDYLEMDDLITAQGPNVNDVAEPLDDLGVGLFDEIDGLSEFDLYQETPSFFTEAGPSEADQISRAYFDEDPSLYLQNYEHVMENNELQQLLSSSNLIDGQAWDDALARQGTVRQSHDFVNGVDENGGKKDEGADSSWFSSALWSFVESIPTNPASASEIALVNKAFVRMSSLGRVGSNARRFDVTPCNKASSTVSKSSGKSRRNFICFSIVGLVCAVLWMVVIR